MRSEAEIKRAVQLCNLAVLRAAKRGDLPKAMLFAAEVCALRWVGDETHDDAQSFEKLLAGWERDFPQQTIAAE